jgi:sulfonate transport system ATP-binding protein
MVDKGFDRHGTVNIEIVRKAFSGSKGTLLALKDILLTINPGEFVCIVGGSGCGKTTLLRIIAGLETEYEGAVFLDGKKLIGTGLDRGVVFQEHRLLSWLTVHDNVGFGLAGLPPEERSREERSKDIRHYISLVGLDRFEYEYPHQLSGGMSQRVAIARALGGASWSSVVGRTVCFFGCANSNAHATGNPANLGGGANHSGTGYARH